MIASEIIAQAREEYLDDVADTAVEDETVYALSDTTLLAWVAEAEREATHRQASKLLYDEDTAEICRITLVEDQRAYALDARVLDIERVLYAGAKLTHTTERALEAADASWRSWDAGTPTAFYVKSRKLYLDRAPSAAVAGALLSLHVWREPLAAPALDEAPEIPPAHHRYLVHWLVYRAKSRRDEETYDAQGAAAALAMFEGVFGRRLTAEAMERRLERPPETVLGLSRNHAQGWYAGTGTRVEEQW